MSRARMLGKSELHGTPGHSSVDNGRAVGIFHEGARLTPAPGTTDEPKVTENQPNPKPTSGSQSSSGASGSRHAESVLKLEDSSAGSTDAVESSSGDSKSASSPGT